MSLLHFRCKERRRTLRVNLTVPLAVHGESEEGEKFCAHTQSHSVSQHGAMMELREIVLVGQVLQLVNENSNRKAEARVVSVQRRRDGKTYVGVEFLSAEINFWHMTFPIPGARPLRKIPSAAKVSAS
jgi:PilZ domain